MKRFVVSVAACLSLLGLTSAAVSAAPETESQVSEDDSTNEFGYWRLAREDLGLASDIATVNRIAASDVGKRSIADFSMPLDQNERELFFRRLEIGEDAARLMEALHSDLNYGGLYLSEELGGPLTVNVLNPSAQFEERVSEFLRHPGEVKFQQVHHSFGELEDRAAQLESEVRGIKGFVDIHIDEITNSVVVGIDSVQLAEEQRSRSASAIATRFEVLPRSEDTACTSRLSCGSGATDFRGGIKIADNNGICTTGFVADDSVGNAYVITAGHCDSSTNKEVQIGGEPHGGAHNYIAGTNLDGPNTETDVVLAGIYVAESSDWIYKDNATKEHTMTYVKTSTWYPTNLHICISALTSYKRCGKVVASSATSNGSNVRNNQVKWRWYAHGNLTTLGGSSGGPTYAYTSVLGIQSVANLNYDSATNRTRVFMYAGKIATIEDDLNITVRTG